MHKNSQMLFDRYVRGCFQPGMRVLEIGPDAHPSHYANSLCRSDLVWHTIDMCDNPSLTYRSIDEYRFPIQDDAYDIVLSGQVLEHVRQIWVWIKEVARVCKPSGLVITINPVSWPYHEAPVDCWRIFPEGMRALYQEAGLEVLHSTCESLEGSEFPLVLAGRGRDWQSRDELDRAERLMPLGAPVECAFDTITIGRKPIRRTSTDDRPATGVRVADDQLQRLKSESCGVKRRGRKHQYGIYTAADDNFFPGVVVQLNSLRRHGYEGPLAVIDTGLEPWMIGYLNARGATVINMDFAKDIRFTDVVSEETAGMRGWSFKAFGILEADLFETFTFIDADYIPLCNVERELSDRLDRGQFLGTEDGSNTWDARHTEAVGVRAGTYVNINAGFFSASLREHRYVLEEWRNVMTRRKPFDLWYGDQGALNAILDKYSVPKIYVGRKEDWNQTWLNESLARDGLIHVESLTPPILRHQDGRRIFGWHGCGWYRYWHCIGIDHYREDPKEIEHMRQECAGKVPQAVLDVFRTLLFQDNDFKQVGPLLVPSDGVATAGQ